MENSPCSTPCPPEGRMDYSSSVCTESRHTLTSTCKSPTYGTQYDCHQNTDTPGGHHYLRPTRKRTRNETPEEGINRCEILQVGLVESWEKENQTTHPQQGQGQGSRDPPIHRRRDRTHLPPNQEDGCHIPCQAPHHHQEHPSGT